MTDDLGFSFNCSGHGKVQIYRQGRLVTTLGERDSAQFLNRVASLSEDQAQREMARATGKYKFGNERTGKNRRKP